MPEPIRPSREPGGFYVPAGPGRPTRRTSGAGRRSRVNGVACRPGWPGVVVPSPASIPLVVAGPRGSGRGDVHAGLMMRPLAASADNAARGWPASRQVGVEPGRGQLGPDRGAQGLGARASSSPSGRSSRPRPGVNRSGSTTAHAAQSAARTAGSRSWAAWASWASAAVSSSASEAAANRNAWSRSRPRRRRPRSSWSGRWRTRGGRRPDLDQEQDDPRLVPLRPSGAGRWSATRVLPTRAGVR
jgi:hypothetical protein